jgi:predicted nucleotide-binding protein
MHRINTPSRKDNGAKVAPIKRAYLSQTDIPNYSLTDASKIAGAIIENYAGHPVSPLKVAQALNLSPNAPMFRMLCGASIAYGLTKGGYNASSIAIEPLALKIFKPKKEGEDYAAKIEAFLKPTVIHDFFHKYDGAAIPREDIAKNVMEEMGVPAERVDEVFDFMVRQGEDVGLITDLKGKKYIELQNVVTVGKTDTVEKVINGHRNILVDDSDFIGRGEERASVATDQSVVQEQVTLYRSDDGRLKKVFVTHGKNTKFIDPIKKLLSFGELMPVVSVERTSISQPVPDKVLNEMRQCGAAIIHVEDEQKLMDEKANEHIMINQNVLIEIGAAMALFGRRFILLVKEGIQLPSNLQGLFEVRYQGDALDGNATIKLLEAINDIKNQKLPQ